MTEFKVYRVIYRSPDYGLAAVAVSSDTAQGAKDRLRSHRPAKILHVDEIPGRRPEYAQDRIEGTVDLENPMAPPPQADSPRAERIRRSNARLIAEIG